jgi:biotin transport system substrate-specific component
MKKTPNVRAVIFSALFAALLVILSSVTIYTGLSPVPFTLQNFVVMLAGGVLGARYGFYSMFTVVALTAVGFPLLHGSGGLGLILGPTGGFIWAYPFGAMIVGWVSTRMNRSGLAAFVILFAAMLVGGSGMLYLTGIPWLAHVSKLSLAKALALGCYPYLIGDVIKAFAAALIVVPVRAKFPPARLYESSKPVDQPHNA